MIVVSLLVSHLWAAPDFTLFCMITFLLHIVLEVTAEINSPAARTWQDSFIFTIWILAVSQPIERGWGRKIHQCGKKGHQAPKTPSPELKKPSGRL
jgi:hypothetical protein